MRTGAERTQSEALAKNFLETRTGVEEFLSGKLDSIDDDDRIAAAYCLGLAGSPSSRILLLESILKEAPEREDRRVSKLTAIACLRDSLKRFTSLPVGDELKSAIPQILNLDNVSEPELVRLAVGIDKERALAELRSYLPKPGSESKMTGSRARLVVLGLYRNGQKEDKENASRLAKVLASNASTKDLGLKLLKQIGSE